MLDSIINPFKYGMVVANANFCGRAKDIRLLVSRILSAQRTVVYGERRIGKTSLILEACKNLPPKPKHRILFVDLMEVKTPEEVLKRILKSLITLEETPNFFRKILGQLAALRPVVGVDPLTSLPEVTLDFSKSVSASSVAEVFKLIEKEHEEGPIVVVLDEFQDITKLKESKEVLALMRSEIQRQENISYVFSGSNRRTLNLLFTNPDSPFFKSAAPLEVGPISDEEFTPFLTHKFELGRRKVSEGLFSRIYEITDRVTGDVQQLCEALWSVSSEGETVSDSHIPKALELIFSREMRSYEMILSETTGFQRKVLGALARVGGGAISSQAFLKEAGSANASSVRKAVQRLVGLRVLFEDNKRYRFVNPFFRAWFVTFQ